MIPERLVSVHFPKAAGSSLLHQLQAHLGDLVHVDYLHDPLTPTGHEVEPFPADKRVVHGHFRPARYSGANLFLITFLREPIDNLASIYFYWLSKSTPDHALHERFLTERPSLSDFAAYPQFATLMSEQYFGAFDMGRFDFIGFHEDRASDLPRLGTLMGIPLDASVHENQTAADERRSRLLADPGVLAAIQNRLRADLEFYDRMRSRAARQAWATGGVS